MSDKYKTVFQIIYYNLMLKVFIIYRNLQKRIKTPQRYIFYGEILFIIYYVSLNTPKNNKIILK